MNISLKEFNATPEEILDFANKYAAAVSDYRTAAIDTLKAEYELSEWLSLALANGIIEGRNEKEREGNARMTRPDLYENMQSANIRNMETYSEYQQYQVLDKAIGRILFIMRMGTTPPSGEIMDTDEIS